MNSSALSESSDMLERWSEYSRCPICNGAPSDPRRRGVRCFGFRGSGDYVHCTREEFAGTMHAHNGGNTYAHRLEGPCRCGEMHDNAPRNDVGKSTRKPAKPVKIVSLEEVRRAYRRNGKIAAEYSYEDKIDGQWREVLRVFRIQLPDDDKGKPQKDFRQASPDGDGWKMSKGSARLVPFHLRQLLEAIDAGDHIHIVEGEADVLAVESAGGVATCNPMGAGKPVEEYARYFEGADRVRIVADRDEPGRKHARAWAKALRGAVAKTELVEAIDGKDAADALEKHALADAFRPWTATEEDDPEAVDTSRFVHVGRDAYDFLRAAPDPVWLVPGVLRIGKTTVLGGSTMTGKSWFCLQCGSSIAAGRPVWPGVAGEVSQGVVVFLGFDPHMTVEDVARRLNALDQGKHRRDQGVKPGAWAEQFVTVGSSEQTGAFPIDRYRLDADGCDALANEILRPIEIERGPIRAVIVDTLSTALPMGVDENDNPAMTAVIARLSGLALDFQAAALTPHHPTKANSSAGTRFNSWDPMAYFRGAGAIPSAAGVLAGLWAPQDQPSHRVLTCWSNSGRRHRTWFEVADEIRGAEGWIDYWWPGVAPDGTRGEVEADQLESLADAFRSDSSEKLSWRAFTIGTQGNYNGSSRARAEKLLAWATARGVADRQTEKPNRVYLTSEGITQLSPFWRVIPDEQQGAE